MKLPGAAMFQRLIGSLSKDGLMIASGVVVLLLLGFITYAAVYVELINKEVVLMLFGGIYTLASGIVGYYFGTSKSSVDKTRIMADKLGDSNSAGGA